MPNYTLLKDGPVFSIKLSKSERIDYIRICEIIWGVVPVDVEWARNTKIYIEQFNLIPPTVKVSGI
jgi:hypothetical protein